MTIKENQSTLDLATQHNGDAKSVVDFCLKNGLSITETLNSGGALELGESAYIDDKIKQYYKAKGHELATGAARADADVLGIGSMIIGTNFDVS
jgi:hypothetical protein